VLLPGGGAPAHTPCFGAQHVPSLDCPDRACNSGAAGWAICASTPNYPAN
jgi:hypothetical protein